MLNHNVGHERFSPFLHFKGAVKNKQRCLFWRDESAPCPRWGYPHTAAAAAAQSMGVLPREKKGFVWLVVLYTRSHSSALHSLPTSTPGMPLRMWVMRRDLHSSSPT